MTFAEVASILKLNQPTVRNWIDQGKLQALRIGRRVRIRRAGFDTQRTWPADSIPGMSRPPG
jgi:excisionase family DNA binding protein